MGIRGRNTSTAWGKRSHSGDSERDVDATTTTIYEYTAIG
jgi:hypothetical protein